jgi:hypothetical protein
MQATAEQAGAGESVEAVKETMGAMRDGAQADASDVIDKK